ncbi:MAG: hypothetical protein SF029_07505 [bacterium]|nr:hypothetical protein [bacterium]
MRSKQQRLQRLAGVLFIVLVLAGCNLESARLELTPVSTPDLPRVEFLFPENNSAIYENIDMTLNVVAYDETAGVARIEILVDGEMLLEATPEDEQPVPIFNVETNWLAQGAARHVFTAIAYRADNTRSDEAVLIVEVQPRP